MRGTQHLDVVDRLLEAALVVMELRAIERCREVAQAAADRLAANTCPISRADIELMWDARAEYAFAIKSMNMHYRRLQKAVEFYLGTF